MVVSNNPALNRVICEEDLCSVSAAFHMEHRSVAELAAVGDAYELGTCELRTSVARILCRTGQCRCCERGQRFECVCCDHYMPQCVIDKCIIALTPICVNALNQIPYR